MTTTTDSEERTSHVVPGSRRALLAASVVLFAVGLAAVLVAVTVLAGWPWALGLGGAVAIYLGFVASTRVPPS